MLASKRAPISFDLARSLKQELDHLYARRLAIDTLIESLEEYSRFKDNRAVRLEKLKSA